MYFFDAQIKLNNDDHDSLIIFSGQDEGVVEEYGYLIEKNFRREKPKPEAVIFIYPDYLNDLIENFIKPSSPFYENITRFGNKVPVLLLSFNGFGCLNIKHKIFISNVDICIKECSKSISEQGIIELVKKHHDSVIVKSPPGTYFLKPSKQEIGEFIQASGLAVGYSENQFLAFSLLRARPQKNKIKKIFIDTSGIASFIEALVYYLFKFDASMCKQVKYYSFNSYFGYKELKPDETSGVWVVISASTSNSLGKLVAKEWGVSDDQVVTVLSYRDKESDQTGDNIVCNISKLSNGYKKTAKFAPTIGVNIKGEIFTPEISAPNAVVIKTKHKPKSIDEFISPYSSSNVFQCSKLSKGIEKVKPIFLNTELIFDKDEKLIKWIRDVVEYYAPFSLNWIIYDPSSSSSIKLLEIVLSVLPKRYKNKCLSYNDAETKVHGNKSVLILDTVVGSGKHLLKLNRNLRISKHFGNRLYLCPFVVAPSKGGFEKFKKSLTLGPDKLNYHFFSYYHVFIGHSSKVTSWELERKVIENFKSDFWRDREKVLSLEGEGLKGKIGVSSISSSGDLSFTNNFAFWPPGYEANNVNPESVYVTISSILQNLRETEDYSADEDSLHAHVYKHSVIDTENFTRLNDGLIQSCLWRAANASELDYKSSDMLSEAFLSIVIRMLDDFIKGDNNAVVDLLVGVSVGKITLSKNVLSKVILELNSKCSEYDYIKELSLYIESRFLD